MSSKDSTAGAAPLTPSWHLYLGDCIEGMRELPDKSVGCLITDPPYSRDLYSRTRTNRGRADLRTPRDVEASLALASLAIGAIDDILEDAASEFVRLTQRWIVAFSDVEIGARWRAGLGGAYVRAGAWVKTDPMPQVSADRPAQGFELATIAHGPERKRWNGGGKAAVWFHGREQIARPDHPCPKPLALMEDLIRDFTDPGEMVCDPFAGSGTTGVACIRLGRRFIGWEKDPKFHAAAVKRLSAARQQYELLPRPVRPKQQGLGFTSREAPQAPEKESA